jgi:hypothetical protein
VTIVTRDFEKKVFEPGGSSSLSSQHSFQYPLERYAAFNTQRASSPVRANAVLDPSLSQHAVLSTQHRITLALVILTFALGLIIDQHAGLAGQLAVGAWTWGVFFWLLRTSPSEWRLPFYACLVWATTGEIFLSLVWGLYTYRLENIPLFIPPGHVLLFYLGLVLAPRVPRPFVASVAVAAVAYLAYTWLQGFDTISIPLTVLFLLCMLQPAGRRVYAVMFIASLGLEVYGTWMGNWVWHADVPYLDLNSANPPLAAGAFYCALDVLAGLTARSLRRVPSHAAVATI